MDTMYFNKVEIKNPQTDEYEEVFNIEDTTTQPNDVRAGKTFYDNLGIKKEGRMVLLPEEENLLTNDYPIRFYNYCGQLMYAYTYEELEALTELPAGRDDAKYGLYFVEWNYTLDEIKRTKGFVDVGAIYSTTPNLDDPPVTKVYVDTSSTSAEVYLYFIIRDGTFTVDWGDGFTQTFNEYSDMWYDGTHAYEIPGEYIIKIYTADSSDYILGWGSGGCPLAAGEAVKGIAIGNDKTKYGVDWGSEDMLFGEGVQDISFVTFPVTCTWTHSWSLGYGVDKLSYIALPRSIELEDGQPHDLLQFNTYSPYRDCVVSVPYDIIRVENEWQTGEITSWIDLSSDFKHITLIPTDSDSYLGIRLDIDDTSLEINKKKVSLTRLDYCPPLEISSSIINKLSNLTKDNIIFYVPKCDGEGNVIDWQNETNWSAIYHLIEEV